MFGVSHVGILKYKFLQAFYSLPVCAILNDRVFCCHGGIGQDLELEEIQTIQRPVNAMNDERLEELMWAEPGVDVEDWTPNADRGASYYFGRDQPLDFLDRHEFQLLVRAHQPCTLGFEFLWDYRHRLLRAQLQREYVGAMLLDREDPNKEFAVVFNLAAGQKVPDCGRTGGGRGKGSSIIEKKQYTERPASLPADVSMPYIPLATGPPPPNRVGYSYGGTSYSIHSTQTGNWVPNDTTAWPGAQPSGHAMPMLNQPSVLLHDNSEFSCDGSEISFQRECYMTYIPKDSVQKRIDAIFNFRCAIQCLATAVAVQSSRWKDEGLYEKGAIAGQN